MLGFTVARSERTNVRWRVGKGAFQAVGQARIGMVERAARQKTPARLRRYGRGFSLRIPLLRKLQKCLRGNDLGQTIDRERRRRGRAAHSIAGEGESRWSVKGRMNGAVCAVVFAEKHIPTGEIRNFRVE